MHPPSRLFPPICKATLEGVLKQGRFSTADAEAVDAGSTSRAVWTLLHRQRQPDGSPPPVDYPRPQARVVISYGSLVAKSFRFICGLAGCVRHTYLPCLQKSYR